MYNGTQVRQHPAQAAVASPGSPVEAPRIYPLVVMQTAMDQSVHNVQPPRQRKPVKRYARPAVDDDDSAAKRQGVKRGRRSQQVMRITNVEEELEEWLVSNYDYVAGASVMRGKVYQHYISDTKAQRPPTNATFGKAVKKVFPFVTARRLGCRGNSKYHYDGLQPRNFKQTPKDNGPSPLPMAIDLAEHTTLCMRDLVVPTLPAFALDTLPDGARIGAENALRDLFQTFYVSLLQSMTYNDAAMVSMLYCT